LIVLAALPSTALVLVPTLLMMAMAASEISEFDHSVPDGGRAMLVLHHTVKNEKHAKPRANVFCTGSRGGARRRSRPIVCSGNAF